jgi:Tol biopolymer transport system component
VAASLDDAPIAILNPSWSWTAGPLASVSSSGSLAYFSTPSTKTLAVWLDASGKTTGTLALPPGHYESATISPDGTQAVLVRSVSPSESTLWLVDLGRGSASPLSSGRGGNRSPVWSPDGKRVIFASDRDTFVDIYVKVVADPGPEQRLYRSDVLFKSPSAWSPDGKWIVLTQLDPVTVHDIWLLPADGQGDVTPYLRGPMRDTSGPPSADGRWLAYMSDDTGPLELYVQSFPGPGHKIQVSSQTASAAWWTRDGRQLLWVDDGLHGLWRANVEPGAEPGATLRVGAPTRIASLPPNLLSIDAMPDRKSFLAITPEIAGAGSMTIVQNWRAALEGKR